MHEMSLACFYVLAVLVNSYLVELDGGEVVALRRKDLQRPFVASLDEALAKRPSLPPAEATTTTIPFFHLQHLVSCLSVSVPPRNN